MKFLAPATVAVTLSLAVIACGSDDSSDSSTPASTPAATSTATTAASAGTDYVALLEEGYRGNVGTPPTTGPAPAKGKNVYVISCGNAAIGCKTLADAASTSAKELGWKVTDYDGQFDPAKFGAGIDQAVAAKADGIMLAGVDCPSAEQPLQRAKKAGIPIVAMSAFDCDTPGVGGEKLFTQAVKIKGKEFYGEVVADWSRARANYVVAKTEGKANIVMLGLDFVYSGQWIKKGAEEIYKKCTTCKLDILDVSANQFPKVQQLLQGELLKTPDVNVVDFLADTAPVAGGGAAVRASGKNDQIKIAMGGEGYAPNADLVRRGTGEQDAGVGFPQEWAGWALTDTMNRAFAKQPSAESGIGWQTWDKDHNLPAKGGWVPQDPDGNVVDFKDAYRTAWNLAG
jgi:ribose transport system substrate-binding protein